MDVDDVFPSQNIDVLQTYLIANRANANNQPRKEEMFRPGTPGARANRERYNDRVLSSSSTEPFSDEIRCSTLSSLISDDVETKNSSSALFISS